MDTDDIREALAAGLHWLYDTPQPDGAILQHHGAGLPVPKANRYLSFVPSGSEQRVVIVIEVARVEWQHQGPNSPPANPIGPTELDEVTALLAELGARVVHTWNGHPWISGSLALERPAHPTLLAAVNRYHKGCPDHRTVFCRCGWYQRGNDQVAKPTDAPKPAL